MGWGGGDGEKRGYVGEWTGATVRVKGATLRGEGKQRFAVPGEFGVSKTRRKKYVAPSCIKTFFTFQSNEISANIGEKNG